MDGFNRIGAWLMPESPPVSNGDAATRDPLPKSLYAQIWKITRPWQIRICLLTAIIAPLSMAPLELQRRLVNGAVGELSLDLLVFLGIAYLLIVLTSNGLKYALNVSKGRVLEEFARDIRLRVLAFIAPTVRPGGQEAEAPETPIPSGTVVSVLAAETELVAGFASECLSVPLLQGGTILSVVAYLLWVQPLIALLAVIIYMPQVILLPQVQSIVNRLLSIRTRQVRSLGHDAVALDQEPGEAETKPHADRLVDKILATRMRIYIWKFFMTFIGNVSDALGPIIVLVVGGYLVSQGKTEVSTLVVFISGFQKLADPWDQLINFYRTASNSHVSYRLIADSLTPKETAEPAVRP